ncbi:iron dicitrate transport regulator FecR [Methylomonas koyamae]|uniref:Iron dicitrate transport regulator FecR n=1 Tax=Methylomonas koyamae TaxID=702114 RepID=A0A177N9T1_9GAMM|nr:FecR domain-containing protein [Methylomonas koyamae]OAI13979.1 iron dicitrate transport regulator FecR [Methylomonas koyamae]
MIFSSDAIRRQAIAWLVRRQSGTLSPRERRAFERWLAVPDHRQTFERVAAAWETLPDPGDALASARRKPRRGLSRYTLAYAACLSLALGLCVLEGWPLHDESVWKTAKGELKTIVLNDGSRVDLNSDSELAVRYGIRQRRLELRRGEALFAVSPLKWRPFEVRAGGAALHDIGTRFDVALFADRSRLAVSAGAVEVVVDATGERQRTDAGQSLFYNGATLLSEPAATDVDALLAWREHRLVFRNVPLVEALKELERYQPVRFHIPDPTVARLQLGGVFGNEDLAAFLTALERVLPVEATSSKNGEITIERRRPG